MSVLYTSDIYDFSQLPNPLEVGIQPYCRYDDYTIHTHPEAGDLLYKNVSLPNLHIADMRWNTERTVQLHNQIPSDSISFVFNLNGKLETTYNSVSKTLELDSGQHYCAYVPEGGFYNEVSANQQIDVFHLSLDKSFFMEVLEETDFWSENVISNLENRRTFVSPMLLNITPEMWILIKNLKAERGLSTVEKFHIQSQAFELIALQIQQMQKANHVDSFPLKAEDVKKLKDLKDYLDKNFLKETSLSRLSRLSYLNEFKLKSGFKLLFDVTVFGYIRQLKMNYAANLLKENVSISSVAYELGYEYPHHFSVAFKNYMGINPSIYQASVR